MDFNWQNGKQTKSRRGAPRFSGFRTVQVPAGGADARVGGTCLQQIFSSQRNELPEWEDNKLSVQGISPRQGPFFMPIPCSCTKAFQTGQLKNFLTPGSPPEGDLTDIPVIFTCWTLLAAEPKGTCLFLEPVSTRFVWKASGESKTAKQCIRKILWIFLGVTVAHLCI